MPRRLHIFNPDTDYALASPRLNYTPPAQVVALRKRLGLLPAIYARPGDTIVLLDEPEQNVTLLPYHNLVVEKGLNVITMRKAAANSERFSGLHVTPWGWNASLRNTLLKAFGNSLAGIPGEEAIVRHKELSHRRTTIKLLEEMRSILAEEIKLPVELFSWERAIAAFNNERNLFFKAPWSSSGRGILLTDDLEERHVAPWVRGVIRSQGSVIMEKAYKRQLDFATEWICRHGEAIFLGYSVFKVSRRGKYHGNVEGTQAELENMISCAAPAWNRGCLASQKEALEKLIAPQYDGPLGIDMLVTAGGAVNPCVEINLRHTMGMLHLLNEYY